MKELILVDEDELQAESTPPNPPPLRQGDSGSNVTSNTLSVILVLLIVGTIGWYVFDAGTSSRERKDPVSAVRGETFARSRPTAPIDNVQKVSQQKDRTKPQMLQAPLIRDTSNNPPPNNSTTVKSLAAMRGDYTVQVSAFREKGRALTSVARLQEAEYPAFEETINLDGITWFTVGIGHYVSMEDATKAVGGFALELQSNFWVHRLRGK